MTDSHPQQSPENALVEIVGTPELLDAVLGAAEAGFDTLLEQDVLREVPVLQSLVGIARAGSRIRDRLFARKLCRFLFELDAISDDERRNFAEQMEEDKSLRERVGTNVLLCLERLDDIEKPELLAAAFRAYIRQKISVDELSQLCSAIDRGYLADLRQLAEGGEVSDAAAQRLYSLGLMSLSSMSMGDLMPNVSSFSRSELGDLLVQTCFYGRS